MKYGVPRNSVSTWIKTKEEIFDAFGSGRYKKVLSMTAELW